MAQKSILLDKSLRFAAPLIPLLSWVLSPKYNMNQKDPMNRIIVFIGSFLLL